MTLVRPVLVGLKPSPFRATLTDWVRDQGRETFVTGEAAEALSWARARPEVVSFLDRDLERLDGEEAWRVVHRVVGHRLVLMAAERTNEVWFSALAEGVGTVLPLPTERDVVLAALRLASKR